ncbi:MAG: hypothetical protein JNL58_05000 [Planctomyces sp.]|nr:hypothetical protein [Planctomyces sp.]
MAATKPTNGSPANTRSSAPDDLIVWHGTVLRAAAIYNILWGVAAILFPSALFRWAGVEPLPNYPELWQCIGMIVGVYGVGYWIAAGDSIRHWPIVLVGLLGKIFGPIGFAQAILLDRFPLKMGVTILTNDLIWWVPFVLILLHARKVSLIPKREPVIEEPLADSSPSMNTIGKQPRPAIVWSSLQSTEKPRRV